MISYTPESAEELADHLRHATAKREPVNVMGNGSKHLMAGPVSASEISLSTRGLNRISHYEPNDLTVSVEAGLSFASLQSQLAKRGQMVALDPPFSAEATVGGIVATNSSGPMRRLFGTARDLVIGMTFVTVDGNTISTGGMVVKNVAGLDIGKLLIGSFGTLGIITAVNFRLHSLPEESRTFAFSYSDLDAAMAQRDAVIRGPLQPAAVDLLSSAAAARLGRRGYLLAVMAHGSRRVIERYARELALAEQINGREESHFWHQIREFSPDFVRRHPGGVVIRASTLLRDVSQVLRLSGAACISRAGSGVSYAHFTSWQNAASFWRAASAQKWSATVEYAPDPVRENNELWTVPKPSLDGNSFVIMKEVKQMFDPLNLLNRSRLYGRI